MRRLMPVCVSLCVVLSCSVAGAQNLLPNGNLDSTVGSVYYDGSDPSLADDVPGWELSLGAVDGSYILVSQESDPLAGSHDADMGISPAGGAMLTAVVSRPAVTSGNGYRASITSDNYFAPTGTSYFIDWFDGVGSLIGSVGGPLGDPNGGFIYAPYTQRFVLFGTAPAGAASAGVRFTSGNPGYAGLAADHFFFGAVPEPSSAVLLGIAAIGLGGFFRRREIR